MADVFSIRDSFTGATNYVKRLFAPVCCLEGRGALYRLYLYQRRSVSDGRYKNDARALSSFTEGSRVTTSEGCEERVMSSQSDIPVRSGCCFRFGAFSGAIFYWTRRHTIYIQQPGFPREKIKYPCMAATYPLH